MVSWMDGCLDGRGEERAAVWLGSPLLACLDLLKRRGSIGGVSYLLLPSLPTIKGNERRETDVRIKTPDDVRELSRCLACFRHFQHDFLSWFLFLISLWME